MLSWIKDKYLNWKIDRLLTSDFEGTADINLFSNSKYSLLPQQQQSEKDYKYQQALNTIKKKIKEEAQAGSLHKVLEKYGNKKLIDDWKKELYSKDLISICNEENLVKQFLKKLNIRAEKDIRTKKDKKAMIGKRIQDYELLQKKREIRALNKELRLATKDNETELAKELEVKLDEKLRELKGKK